MKTQSAKFRARAREVKALRKALVAKVGRCECCGHDPQRVRPGMIAWELACHEIANGPNRQKCLDKPFGLLVTCWPCNTERLTDKTRYPVSRQLWLLRRSRPGDFDLEAYLREFHPRAPRAVTMEEVDAWETD